MHLLSTTHTRTCGCMYTRATLPCHSSTQLRWVNSLLPPDRRSLLVSLSLFSGLRLSSSSSPAPSGAGVHRHPHPHPHPTPPWCRGGDRGPFGPESRSCTPFPRRQTCLPRSLGPRKTRSARNAPPPRPHAPPATDPDSCKRGLSVPFHTGTFAHPRRSLPALLVRRRAAPAVSRGFRCFAPTPPSTRRGPEVTLYGDSSGTPVPVLPVFRLGISGVLCIPHLTFGDQLPAPLTHGSTVSEHSIYRSPTWSDVDPLGRTYSRRNPRPTSPRVPHPPSTTSPARRRRRRRLHPLPWTVSRRRRAEEGGGG